MENHINDLIIKSLKYFDNQNKKYSKYLQNTELIIDNKIFKILDKKTEKIINIDTTYLGIFNHETNTFLWAWSLPDLSINEIKISKELLNYGLSLQPSSNTISHYFLKSLLVNARNNIETDFDLDLIQAISSYLLKDKCDFIYPSYVYNNNKVILTSYFIVKISNK